MYKVWIDERIAHGARSFTRALELARTEFIRIERLNINRNVGIECPAVGFTLHRAMPEAGSRRGNLVLLAHGRDLEQDLEFGFAAEVAGYALKGRTGRIANERKILEFGDSVNWDREKVVVNCLENPSSGWLGREVFETSFDDGSMRYMANWYDLVGLATGV